LHFLVDCITKEKSFKRPGGKDIQYKLCNPTLVVRAVSSLFPNLPEYLSDKTMKRKPPELRIDSTKKNSSRYSELRWVHNYI